MWDAEGGWGFVSYLQGHKKIDVYVHAKFINRKILKAGKPVSFLVEPLGENGQPVAIEVQGEGIAEETICRHYLAGNCRDGMDCVMLHQDQNGEVSNLPELLDDNNSPPPPVKSSTEAIIDSQPAAVPVPVSVIEEEFSGSWSLKIPNDEDDKSPPAACNPPLPPGPRPAAVIPEQSDDKPPPPLPPGPRPSAIREPSLREDLYDSSPTTFESNNYFPSGKGRKGGKGFHEPFRNYNSSGKSGYKGNQKGVKVKVKVTHAGGKNSNSAHPVGWKDSEGKMHFEKRHEVSTADIQQSRDDTGRLCYIRKPQRENTR